MSISYHAIKNILRGNKGGVTTPADDFRVIDSYAIYDDNSNAKASERKLKYLCYEIESMDPESGEKHHFFKALKFCRVIRLPKSAKQSTALMDMQQQVLAAAYSQDINLVTVIANIISPVPLGLLYLYGVQGVASDIEKAKEQADQDFIGFTRTMQGTYRVLEMQIINAQETEWLREKMYNMNYMTVVRGIPKASKSGENMGNKGIGNKNLNPDSQGTLEEFIAAMVDYEYVVQVLSTPIKHDTLKEWHLQTSKHMTDWNSQLQGTSSLSFGISMPMMTMANQSNSTGWSKAYTEADSVTSTTGESFNVGLGESVSESMSRSFSESMGLSHSESFSESSSVSMSETRGETLGTTIGESIGQSLGSSQGNTFGSTVGTTLGQTSGLTEGSSFGQSMGSSSSVSQNTNISHGFSQNESVTQSISQNVSNSQSFGQSQNYSESQGESFSQSHGFGTNSSFGTSTNQSSTEGSSQTHTAGTSTNQTVTNTSGTSHTVGTSSSESNGQTHTETHSESTSNGTSESSGTTGGISFTKGTSDTDSKSGSAGFLGLGGNWGDSHTKSSSTSTSVSTSHTSGTTSSETYSDSQSNSDSHTISQGTNESMGQSNSQSNGYGTGTSVSDSAGYNQSNTYGTGTSESYGSSENFSTSNGQNFSTSFGVGQNYSESQSISNGISSGTSTGISHSQNVSTGNGYSQSTNIGQNISESISKSTSNSLSNSQSNSASSSSSVNFSNSYTGSKSDSHSQSYSESKGYTEGTSKGYSDGTTYTKGESQGYTEGSSISKSISKGTSNSESVGQSRSISDGTSGARVSGMSSSMGFGPSISYNKSYQWMDQTVKDILELLEFQNERLKKSLRGEGAFYTYVYIACPSRDALSAAQAVAKSTWQNEFAMVNPLQILKLSNEEQSHLLYHFSAFSSDVTRENVAGILQYRYCTVLTPSEFVAYTHLPRISEGGIFADVNDIPIFAVKSEMKGEIYMGTILSAERYSLTNGYKTPYDFRIDESELMHGFFTGASRSGKTVAAMRFVTELSKVRRKNTGKRLRIVCMDPKRDWRTLARWVEPERFRFHSLGNASFRPVYINPFKIPKGVVPQTWIDGVIDIYCRAYGLLERGKQMMGETIYALYENAGVFEVSLDDPNWSSIVQELSSQVTFPKVYAKMEEIKAKLEDPTNPKGRAGNDTRDAYARLLDRLQCFSRPFTIETKLFGSSKGISIDELIGNDDVTILESSGLEKTFKNFIFGIITSGFYQFAKAHEGGYLAKDQYETVLVIEEANEVLIGNDAAGSGGGSAMGMSLSGQSEFEEILDQSAGYGLFIIAITQKISDMPKSVVANSGLVFSGRLKIPDDITTVVRSVAREERYDDRELVKLFPRMPTGMFVCQRSRTFDIKDAEPYLVQIARLPTLPPTNLEIDEILAKKEAKLHCDALEIA